MKVAIFGKSNAIAHGLRRLLANGGSLVEVFSKSCDRNAEVDEHYFAIEERTAPDLTGFDVLVYSSWVSKPRSRKTMRRNIETFAAIVEEARRCRTRIVFVSTLGVLGDRRSFHVAAKQECEALLPKGSAIVRPATVVDNDSGKIRGATRFLDGTSKIRLSTYPKILVPTVGLKTALELINTLVLAPGDGTTKEFNLIERISHISWPLSPDLESDVKSLELPLFLLVALLSAARLIRPGRDAWDSWLAIRDLQGYLKEVRGDC